MSRLTAVLAGYCALALGPVPTFSTDDAWSRFRGPNGAGIVESGEFPPRNSVLTATSSGRRPCLPDIRRRSLPGTGS